MSPLCPKNLPVAIIGAMEQEIVLLRDAMECCSEIKIAGMSVYRGGLEARDVVLMQCGIGKVNAAIGTTLLLDHFKAGAVINTGSAGALATHLQVGDVVVADSLVHHDVDVTAFGYAPGQMAQMPAEFFCDSELAAKVHVAAESSGITVESGMIVSGDQFVNGGEALEHIRRLFPKAAAVEMEAAAIAQVCYCFGVPFVVIRAISDNADGSAGVSFESFLEHAAQRSAEMVGKILSV